jgi:hypothetical protein
MSTCFLFRALNATVNAVIQTDQGGCPNFIDSLNLSSCEIEKNTLVEGLTNFMGGACTYQVNDNDNAYNLMIYADKTLEAYPQFAKVVNCIINKLNDDCNASASNPGVYIALGVTAGVILFIAACCCGCNLYSKRERSNYETIPGPAATQLGLLQRCSNWLWRSNENLGSTAASNPPTPKPERHISPIV